MRIEPSDALTLTLEEYASYQERMREALADGKRPTVRVFCTPACRLKSCAGEDCHEATEEWGRRHCTAGPVTISVSRFEEQLRAGMIPA